VPFSLTYMKMRQVPLMFHRAFRDYTKRIGFSEFARNDCLSSLVAPHDLECACACNTILRGCFPGNGRPEPRHLEIKRLAERRTNQGRSFPRCHVCGSSELSSGSIMMTPKGIPATARYLKAWLPL